MSSLLEELTNLEYQKEYSVVLNGISIAPKFENIKEEYQQLLDFKLTQKKELNNKYFVLEFKGKTNLEQKEIVQFLIDLISYKTKKFRPLFLTVGLRKEIHQPSILIVVEMKKSESGELRYTEPKSLKTLGNVALIGDYFFQNYEDYQRTLQELVDIWINN